MIELLPLTRFEETYPVDINADGLVVGRSYSPSEAGLPDRRATIWLSSGVAFGLGDAVNRSEALRINDEGTVLYVQYADPVAETNPKYLLWKNGTTTDLATLVPNLIAALDLSDTLVLCSQTSSDPAQAGSCVLDLATGGVTTLPALVLGGVPQDTYAIAIDATGRAVCRHYLLNQPPTLFLDRVWYLSPGASAWTPTPVRAATTDKIWLSKSGYVLSSVPGGPGINRATYFDLGNPSAGVQFVPRLDPAYPDVCFLEDETDGRFVGGQYNPYATLYDAQTGVIQDLGLLLSAGWKARYAVGINHAGLVVGWGAKDVGSPATRDRGWIVDLGPRGFGGRLGTDRLGTLVWQILFGGVENDGGGIGVIGGDPIPIDPLRALAAERRDVVTILAQGALAAQIRDPELRHAAHRSEITLLSEAIKRMAIRADVAGKK